MQIINNIMQRIRHLGLLWRLFRHGENNAIK